MLPANGLPFSCRERAGDTAIKKGMISRAKRSAATACSAAFGHHRIFEACCQPLSMLYLGAFAAAQLWRRFGLFAISLIYHTPFL